MIETKWPNQEGPVYKPPLPGGWICPKCGRSYGPDWYECMPCNKKIADKEKAE